MVEVERITLDPDPPQAGQKLTICYKFEGSGRKEATLVVTFTPRTGGGTFEVTEEEPCVTIDVPAGATWITVEDEGGPSPDASAPVEQ